MSKTAQRKAAAWAKGAKDGFEGRARSCKDRRLKKDYDTAYDAGRADRRVALMTPDARKKHHDEWMERCRENGPDPVQHEVARPYRGY